jgi:hypothetical protein
MLPRAAKPKEDKSATAAAALCDLCDVYTRSGLEGKWRELAGVYEVRAAWVCRQGCIFAFSRVAHALSDGWWTS